MRADSQVARSLVRRERDAEDERQVRIRLTEKGGSLRERAGEIQGALTGSLGETEEVIGALRSSLTALTRQLRTTEGIQPGRRPTGASTRPRTGQPGIRRSPALNPSRSPGGWGHTAPSGRPHACA